MTGANWRDEAACLGTDPALWFTAAAVPNAKKICRGCEVLRACGEAASDAGDTCGVAAGYDLASYEERRQLRIFLGRADQPDHGESTKVCPSCGQQFATRMRVRRCPSCRGLADMAPVHRHIDQLRRSGRLMTEIAALAGISPSSLGHALWGKGGKTPGYMAQDRAERILAIPVLAERAAS